MRAAELAELERFLTEGELEELQALLAADLEALPWRPLPGPQTLAYESEADVIGYGGAAGGGKGLALDTPLATPTGWVTMGDVAVGQELFDEQGQVCRVTAVSDVSRRPCFRLTFDDGTTLVADDVHRWLTFDASELGALTRRDPEWRARRRAARPSRAKPGTSAARAAALALRNAACVKPLPPPTGTVRDTRTISETLLAGRRRNHAISVAAPLALPDAALPIPPYVLGAWLGDGSSRNGQITGEDAYVWERIEAEGFEVRHYAWNAQAHSVIDLKVRLRALGVLENKHIPEAYLRASYAQRLALMQGLMDTDGHAALDGGCEFDNTNRALAEGVRRLAATLGLKSTLQEGKATLNGRVVGPKWRVKFTTSTPVFGMPRKAERLKARTRRTTGLRYVVGCEPVATVPTRCIAVDSPSRLYLAGEQLVPTHNTDLACGKALTQHRRAAIFRREAPQLVGILDRLTELLGSREGYSSRDNIWRHAGARDVTIEFGSTPNLGDERKHQGRPKDLLVIDEATNMLEAQARFLMGWVRSTVEGQRCQTLMTFNPPTDSDGRWVVSFFAPWLDDMHPLYPAPSGKLLWVATVDGKDDWSRPDDRRPFVLVEGERVYEFNRADHDPTDIVTPQSRTFIPSRVTDNPFLYGTGYMTTLQALPEPLRSQMLRGDFKAGMEDSEWQTIPTAWVDAAMARWKDLSPRPTMDSIGFDVARGGRDKTIGIARHGMWFARPKVEPGPNTPNGPTSAAMAIGMRRDGAVIHVDGIGVGAATYDFLVEANQDAVSVIVSEGTGETDKSGMIGFTNLRSLLWWRAREALDPEANNGIALPPVQELRADLCAPRWRLKSGRIEIESREEIVKRIGRSPDYGSAFVLALMDTPKSRDVKALMAKGRGAAAQLGHDPFAILPSVQRRGGGDYDPFA